MHVASLLLNNNKIYRTILILRTKDKDKTIEAKNESCLYTLLARTPVTNGEEICEP
jgi:hypothetical protein